jgi:hypothetical protein
MVGAIHGRLLTAWATAGILGPVVVNYMREYQLSLGLPREQVYNQTMLILAGLLMVGLICNLLIRPVADKWFMTDVELAAEKSLEYKKIHAHDNDEVIVSSTRSHPVLVWLAWLAVGIPLGWGIVNTLINASKFFS